MARIVAALAIAAALVASASAMPMLPDGVAFCSPDSPSQFVMANGQFLVAKLEQCRRLYSYGIDMYNNVTLAQQDSNSCDDNDKISWAVWQPQSNTLKLMYSEYGNNGKYLELSPSHCNTVANMATDGFKTTGVLCGAGGVSLAVYDRWAIRRTWNAGYGQYCAHFAQFSFPSNINNRDVSNQLSTCGATMVDSEMLYDRDAQVAYESLSGLNMMTTLNKSTCGAASSTMPAKSYCFSSDSKSETYSWGSIAFAEGGKYLMITNQSRPSYGSQRICPREGTLLVQGTSVMMNWTGLSNDGVCSPGTYPEQLMGAKYHAHNDSFTFVDDNYVFFTATTCPNFAPSIPNGNYCGGEYAGLNISGTNFQITSYWNNTATYCSTMGSFVPTMGGLKVIASSVSSTCQATVPSITYNATSGTVFVVVRRGAVTEGIAFARDFCNSKAGAVPDGTWCNTFDGMESMVMVKNGVMAMSLNSSSRVQTLDNDYQCGFAGRVVQQNNQISYVITAMACRTSSTPVSVTTSGPDIIVRGLYYTNGKIGWTLEDRESTMTANGYTNYTTEASACPSWSSPVAQQDYCAAVPPQGAYSPMMMVRGPYVFYVDLNSKCLRYRTLGNASGDGTIPATTQLTTCSDMATTTYENYFRVYTVLPNGDLYEYLDSSSTVRRARTYSAGACSANWSPKTASATFCGIAQPKMAPAPSSGPTPSPAPTNSTPAPPPGPTSKPLPTGLNVTMAVSTNGQFFIVIADRAAAAQTPANAVYTPCRMVGWLTFYDSSASFDISGVDSCSAWRPKGITYDPTNWALTFEIADGSATAAGTLNFTTTMSVNSCQSSVGPAGEYTPAPVRWDSQYQINMMSQYPVNSVLAAGDFLLYAYVTSSSSSFGSGENVMLSQVNLTGTNVSATKDGACRFNTLSKTSVSSCWTTNDNMQVDVNRVGSHGLSLSSTYGTYAFHREGATAAHNVDQMAFMASAPIAALGGKVYGMFYSGGFNLMFPGKEANYKCWIQGSYAHVGPQLTLIYDGSNTNTWNCGSYFNLGSVQILAGDSVTFNLWWNNASTAVELTTGGCATPPTSLPNGATCGGSSTSFICGDRVVTMDTPAVNSVTPSRVANLTDNGNGTATATTDMGSLPISPSQEAALLPRMLVKYNQTAQAILAWDYQSRFVGFKTAGGCFSTPQLNPLLDGPYCGYGNDAAKTKMTLIAAGTGPVDGLTAVINFTSAPGHQCGAVVIVAWDSATGLVELSDLNHADDCRFTTSSVSAARFRWTGGYMDNKSFALKLWGESYTSTSSAGTPVEFWLQAGGCGDFESQPALVAAATPYMAQGVYTARAYMTSSKAFVLGNQYVVAVYNGQGSSIFSGTYQPPSAALAASEPKAVSNTDIITYNVGYSGSTYRNVSYVSAVSKLQIARYVRPMGTDVWEVMALAYQGAADAQQAVAAAAAAKKAAEAAAAAKKEEEKKKTIIIAVVCVVVVLVLVVIGVIVAKSRGSKEPQTQPGGQDYRPMTAV